MKSTWFSDRRRYEFAKCLTSADYSLQNWDLMDCFLQAAHGAMRQGARAAAGLAMDEEIEDRVIKAQKRVKKPEKLAECMGILTLGLESNASDFLGSLIMELGQADVAWRGQCFTPQTVCEMMARLTLGDRSPDPNNPLLLNEPACGGGAMTIATTKILWQNGFYPWHYHWCCVDVDWRMYAISYIQLSLLGIPATVIHGNTLTLEQWDSADTLAAAMHPKRWRAGSLVTSEPESNRPKDYQYEASSIELEETATKEAVLIPTVCDKASQAKQIQHSLF